MIRPKRKESVSSIANLSIMNPMINRRNIYKNFKRNKKILKNTSKGKANRIMTSRKNKKNLNSMENPRIATISSPILKVKSILKTKNARINLLPI